MPKPTARLTTPAEMVAALPLQLGYVPTESLVVLCCHEPRGRVGLSFRIDLPGPGEHPALVTEVVARVRQERASRVLLAVYTATPGERPLDDLVADICAQLAGVRITDALLVRGDRFWSYRCDDPVCCPPEGTHVDTAREQASVRLLETETVLSGRVVLPSREALAQTLAGPTFLAAQVADQRCRSAPSLPATSALSAWAAAVARWQSPPADLGDQEAATLVVSLRDVLVRDALADYRDGDAEALRALLAELCRRTPPPWDAPVLSLFAWVAYCDGGGTEVTIALARALESDPTYSLAHLLLESLQQQVRPDALRGMTRRAGRAVREMLAQRPDRRHA